MQRNEGRDHRSRSLCRSHSHAGKHSSVHEYSTICGNTQEQERTDAVRQTCKSQIQIWKQKFLDTRLLRGYGGKERTRNKRIHQESNKEIEIVMTSCRIVNFDTLLSEVNDRFEVIEYGITEIENHFDRIMYIVLKKALTS